jgi:hypothetical protein
MGQTLLKIIIIIIINFFGPLEVADPPPRAKGWLRPPQINGLGWLLCYIGVANLLLF